MKLLHHSYSTNGVRPSAPPLKVNATLAAASFYGIISRKVRKVREVLLLDC